MSEVNKIRIKCNPYEKKIEYFWYFREDNEFRNLDEYSAVLSNEKYSNATIQNRAFEIVQIINQYFNPGDAGIELYFTGNAEDYADLCSVIETYYPDNNISCIRDGEYYFSADTVMPQIKEKFAEVESTLDSYKEDRITELLQKYNDTIKPSISVCIMGLYSSGKSAFINGLVGKEILPSASDPTTAKICKIVSADKYGISVMVNNQVHNILFEGSGYTVEGNYAAELRENLDKSLAKYSGLKEVGHINKTISLINLERLFLPDEETGELSDKEIGAIVEITIPFKTEMDTEKFEFIIYDTPGSNSASNREHFTVLQSSLDDQTNALPVILTTPDTMDSTDNNDLLKLIEETGTALDTTNAIIIVNKADEKGPNALNDKKEKCESLKITKWKSTRIYFMSSIIGMASKKEDPHNDDSWIDGDAFELFGEKCAKFENGSRKLYEYNIIDKSKAIVIDPDEELSLQEKLYYNSGLASIEKEINSYAERYAMYTKCQQAIKYLKDAIDICSENIHKSEDKLTVELEDARVRFETKKAALLDNIETEKNIKVPEITIEFTDRMLADFNSFIEEESLKYNTPWQLFKLKIYEDFRRQWEEYSRLSKSLGKDSTYTLSLMQTYVKRRYNLLINTFSSHANEVIEEFWDQKSSEFKRSCHNIISESDGFTDEQKEILDAIVMNMENMTKDRADFDIRDAAMVKMGWLSFFNLKGILKINDEIYDNGLCCRNLIKEYTKLIMERIHSVCTENGNIFVKWSDNLVTELTQEICKFNAELNDYRIKIDTLKKDIEERKASMKLLMDTEMYVLKLLGVQS